MNGSTAGVSFRRLDDHRQLLLQSTGRLGRARSCCSGSAPLSTRASRQAQWSRTLVWSPGTPPHRRRARASRSASAVFPARCPRSMPRNVSRCSVDLGSPGIVDPGDTLRYTITMRELRVRMPPPASSMRRRRSGEHDLRREFYAAQRVAFRPAGWRRFAACFGRQISAGSGSFRPEPQRPFSSTCASTPARPPEL